ncbi:hypothetical protein DFJ43DRAFT_1009110, partial [Lentinula guzmanii]
MQSQGHRVYWKERKNVTVERSVIFAKNENGGLRLEIEMEDDMGVLEREGEKEEIPTEATQFTSNPGSSVLNESSTNEQSSMESPNLLNPSAEQPTQRPIRNRIPSQRVRELLDGTGVSGSKDLLPRGINTAVNSIVDIPPEELMMEACIADVEGVEPKTVTEAKRLPDWPK